MSEPIPESKKELARAMVRAGQSYREVASALDISHGTVYNAMKTIDMDVTELGAEIRATLSAKSLVLGDYILNRISDGIITQASLKERALAAAILIDKGMALEKMDRSGQSKKQDIAELFRV